LPSGRYFPDTFATIGVLSDQLPSMNAAQTQFAATHYVGTEKQLLPVTQALRAINPNFLVLHYHLSMWQSAVDFIINGTSWGNDLPTVTTHESWFWHNQQSQRVTAPDGKYLMNLLDPNFQAYWQSSLEQQVADGQYDGIFFDSAAPSVIQGWCGAEDARLAATGVKDTPIAEWGGKTFIQGWEAWIKPLNDALAAKGIPLLPNTSNFVTSWDSTNYGMTAGIFDEGYADTSLALADWQASTKELLSLAAADKLMILQNYMKATDVATRLYYLGNYLLVKGHHTYVFYFDQTELEWYPEWTIDLGAPVSATLPTDPQTLFVGGVYRRDFAKGAVLVNPSASPVMVTLGATLKQVTPVGGGAVLPSGAVPGSLSTAPVTSVSVPAVGAVILLK
jgi:hypothetical protein